MLNTAIYSGPFPCAYPWTRCVHLIYVVILVYIDAPSLSICCVEINTMNQAADNKCNTLEGYSNSRRRLLRQLLGVSAGLPVKHLLAMASASPQNAQHQTQQQHTAPACTS